MKNKSKTFNLKIMLSMKCFLAFAIIATLACSTFAIHCYQCESLSNPNCGEHFKRDDSLKFNCIRLSPPRFLENSVLVRNATGCMKKVLEVDIGSPQIIRSCFFGDIANTPNGCSADPSLPFVKQLSCDVCFRNFCNGARSFS